LPTGGAHGATRPTVIVCKPDNPEKFAPDRSHKCRGRFYFYTEQKEMEPMKVKTLLPPFPPVKKLSAGVTGFIFLVQSMS